MTDILPQHEFCAYCQAISATIDTVIERHGAHAALNVVAALLGSTVFKVANPEAYDLIFAEVSSHARLFAGDLSEDYTGDRSH